MAYLERIFEHAAEAVTIPNPLTFSGAIAITGVLTLSGGLTVVNDFCPATSDGAALGSTTKMWSDLFLASGGVVNFDNGDVTLTHGSNILTMAGGVMAFSDATEASAVGTASVKLVGGLGVAKKLYLGTDLVMVGGDIDLSAGVTGTYDLILKDAVADALSIRRATTDMVLFDSATPKITITPAVDITGVVTFAAQDIHSLGLTVANAKAVIQGMNTFPKLTPTILTSAAGYTMSAAQMLSGLIEDTTNTGGIAATLPTVAAVVALIGGYVAGTSFYLDYSNPGNQTVTLTVDASAQWTMNGLMTIATTKSKRFLCVINSATTGTFYNLGDTA